MDTYHKLIRKIELSLKVIKEDPALRKHDDIFEVIVNKLQKNLLPKYVRVMQIIPSMKNTVSVITAEAVVPPAARPSVVSPPAPLLSKS